MPYKLRKAPNKDLYWVVGEDGKHKSKEPMPKKKALAQMRALYANERKEGGGWFQDCCKWLDYQSSSDKPDANPYMEEQNQAARVRNNGIALQHERNERYQRALVAREQGLQTEAEALRQQKERRAEEQRRQDEARRIQQQSRRSQPRASPPSSPILRITARSPRVSPSPSEETGTPSSPTPLTPSALPPVEFYVGNTPSSPPVFFHLSEATGEAKPRHWLNDLLNQSDSEGNDGEGKYKRKKRRLKGGMANADERNRGLYFRQKYQLTTSPLKREFLAFINHHITHGFSSGDIGAVGEEDPNQGEVLKPDGTKEAMTFPHYRDWLGILNQSTDAKAEEAAEIYFLNRDSKLEQRKEWADETRKRFERLKAIKEKEARERESRQREDAERAQRRTAEEKKEAERKAREQKELRERSILALEEAEAERPVNTRAESESESDEERVRVEEKGLTKEEREALKKKRRNEKKKAKKAEKKKESSKAENEDEVLDAALETTRLEKLADLKKLLLDKANERHFYGSSISELNKKIINTTSKTIAERIHLAEMREGYHNTIRNVFETELSGYGLSKDEQEKVKKSLDKQTDEVEAINKNLIGIVQHLAPRHQEITKEEASNSIKMKNIEQEREFLKRRIGKIELEIGGLGGRADMEASVDNGALIDELHGRLTQIALERFENSKLVKANEEIMWRLEEEIELSFNKWINPKVRMSVDEKRAMLATLNERLERYIRLVAERKEIGRLKLELMMEENEVMEALNDAERNEVIIEWQLQKLSGKGLVGAGIWDIIKDAFNPRKVVNEFVNPDSIVRRRITDVSKGIRKDYPPSARKTIEQYGDWQIVKLQLRRDVVQSAIHVAFNILSLGEWDKARRDANYDKLFHLGLVATVENAGSRHHVLIEKNEVLNIGATKPMMPDTEVQDAPTPNETLARFLEKGENLLGRDAFFLYDPFRANCQDFIAGLLNANGVMTPAAREFIKQDVTNIVSKLPSYVAPVARAITDAGAYVNVAMEGAGTGGRGGANKFYTQLRKAGIEPSAYLNEAKRRAKAYKYPSKLLGFAQDGVHKLAIPDENGRMVAFGKVGYGDHLIYSHMEASQKVPSGTASKKQNTFQKSHSKMKGDWQKNPFSPNNLALKILW